MRELTLDTNLHEPDYKPLYILDVKAFANEPKIRESLQLHGLDPDHLTVSIRSFKAGVFHGPLERAVALIRNTNTDTPVSFISAKVYRGEQGIVDAEHPVVPIQLPDINDPGEREYWEWFWDETGRGVRGVVELHRPVVVIQVLATDPAWQRRGAASELLRWVLSFAGEAGLGVAVQPGSLAWEIGFYDRFGFGLCKELAVVPGRERFLERGSVDAPMLVRDVTG